MAVGKKITLDLYRNLLKESKKWRSYNYREYALRKVRYEFWKNKNITNADSIATCYAKGIEALEIIKRQVMLGNMYGTRNLVIETKESSNNN